MLRRIALLLLALPLAGSCVKDPAAAGVTNALNVCALSSDGALCDDGHPCTVNDVCLNKVCVGTPVADGTPCTDGDLCTLGDTCLASLCVGAAAPDGYPCTDDNLCTDSDSCKGGKCHSGPRTVCDDGDPCTVDMCMPASGCVSSSRECVAPPDAAADSRWRPGRRRDRRRFDGAGCGSGGGRGDGHRRGRGPRGQ